MKLLNHEALEEIALGATVLRAPIVDADGMGRAFPEIQMVTPTLHGVLATPMALADEKGNQVLLETPDNFWTERLARNENLVFWRDGQPGATVPDLITVVDEQTGLPITTEALKYGLRVVVLGIPCHPQWRTPEGLALVGPL